MQHTTAPFALYHSEHGQDRWLEEHVFKGKRRGVFVECGALDGLFTSNTLFFEREREWTGLLIEANPLLFCHLLRSGRQAPKFLGAIGGRWDISTFSAVAGVPGWSGLAPTMDIRHRDRVLAHGQGEDRFCVPTVPLTAVLQWYGFWHIDYLSLDIEGGELAALESIDWDNIRIDVLDVENNYATPQVERYLKEKGYRKITRLEINDIYRR